ncbi:hypothetical protein AXF42_Ash000523 [Apostasia shenzhenica]|uniref:Agenet domain-containing protein n=1 Tax=Apostasia shenzhenica TaxID=1088818 RepID=A0A2I0AGM7_9ASPA|nr:hypothetical protein AXF42_Ash000523 [Apostasia shenzhenica]
MDFKTGDEVEVSSVEEGFRGSWYAAKVVRSMPRLSRYTVSYDTIVEEKDESQNLRETVDAVYVRPRPPESRAGAFTLKQHVDAFYNDGWWAGIVCGEIGSGGKKKYRVSFPATGEVMEFIPSELRVHLDWVNKEWVTPKSQKVLGTAFGNGTPVEVSSDEEGFLGAWFSATVIKSVDDKFLVEYKDLTTEDGTEFLKEVIDRLHIRPAPPASPESWKFRFLEEIDAYCNDGWWVGVISKVLSDSRYIVYFKTWMQEIEFSHENLRPHHDWINGRWMQASQALGF